jgi:Tfp pilus assembly protein PilE
MVEESMRGKMKIRNGDMRDSRFERGFTFIEAILYVAIVSVMLTALIPFVWNIVEGGSKSSVQQEVSGNARFISERIKYEIRNSFGVTSPATGGSANSLTLCENSGSCITSPTVIAVSGSNITIQDKGVLPAVQLNSNDVSISGLSFTNNTSADNKTKNVSFSFTIQQKYSGARVDFKSSMTIQSSAEVRSN